MDGRDRKQIFLSYSTRDTVKAEAIREALENAGMSCWIAPRDLSAGVQWGTGIVEAIEDCKAVLVVFSSASNDSPQVAREMELAVSNRKPLIPVRVQDVMPTQDMQYFLGVSHWFNAYAKPIEPYLPEIVEATRKVLNDQAHTWRRFGRKLPQSNTGRIALGVGVVLLLMLLLGLKKLADPMAAFRSPMTGRWVATIKGPNGSGKCYLDVQATAQISYSEDCPPPVTNARGALAWAKDSTWAPQQFKGGDTGTFLFQGGSAHGYAAAVKISMFGMTTRDAVNGDIKWRKTSSSGTVKNSMDALAPKTATWPLSGTPALVKTAQDYVRAHWQADAVLMSMDAKLNDSASGSAIQTPAGGLDISLEFYSPGTQHAYYLYPGAPDRSGPGGTVDRNSSEALPTDFLDLPAAVDIAHQNGMRGKDIKEAQLEFSGGEACGTGNFAIDNAILPKCRPGRYVGPQWQIDSALGERIWVRAAK